MAEQIHKLESFIKEIIDYSRVSRTKIELQEIHIDLMIQEIFEGLRFMENADQINLSVQIQHSTPIISDKRNLDIILNNLLSNAIKYADPAKYSYVNIIVKQHEQTIEITIEDNGIGIKEEFQDQIFDMFFRATDRSVGSGLGLFIVKEAIEKMNGHITLQSTYGQGSTFVVQFQNGALS